MYRYKEEGTTTTPFHITIISEFRQVFTALIDRVVKLHEPVATELLQMRCAILQRQLPIDYVRREVLKMRYRGATTF